MDSAQSNPLWSSVVYETEGNIRSYVGLDLTDNKINVIFYLRAVYVVPKWCRAVPWKRLQPPLETTTIGCPMSFHTCMFTTWLKQVTSEHDSTVQIQHTARRETGICLSFKYTTPLCNQLGSLNHNTLRGIFHCKEAIIRQDLSGWPRNIKLELLGSQYPAGTAWKCESNTWNHIQFETKDHGLEKPLLFRKRCQPKYPGKRIDLPSKGQSYSSECSRAYFILCPCSHVVGDCGSSHQEENYQ